MKKIWKWIIARWLEWKPPNLKRTTRIRRYPLGTRYVDSIGQGWRYIRKIGENNAR